ncbi:CGNR zinc finger domain-containing protein [Pseudomonas phoenicis]|uniref:CGNR zinc finger domain-containing protein n=1 Tax=unclassified Pseudomonas TaxID=196821 RepID=UPI0039A0FECE
MTPNALFLADNVALDFINSEYGVGDNRHDCLVDDQSVLGWLQTAGLLPHQPQRVAPKGLLALARQLRTCAREVIDSAMKGSPADPAVINALLEAGRPVRQLVWNDEKQAYRISFQQRDSSAESLLEPIAEALVALVTHDKFEFVRQCEAHDCVLLFHDLTKSHRRRWCSMATCGNRMKVAAFRSRNKS